MAKFADKKEPLAPGYASWYEGFDEDDGGFAALGVALLALHLHEPESRSLSMTGIKDFLRW